MNLQGNTRKQTTAGCTTLWRRGKKRNRAHPHSPVMLSRGTRLVPLRLSVIGSRPLYDVSLPSTASITCPLSCRSDVQPTHRVAAASLVPGILGASDGYVQTPPAQQGEARSVSGLVFASGRGGKMTGARTLKESLGLAVLGVRGVSARCRLAQGCREGGPASRARGAAAPDHRAGWQIAGHVVDEPVRWVESSVVMRECVHGMLAPGEVLAVDIEIDSSRHPPRHLREQCRRSSHRSTPEHAVGRTLCLQAGG